MALVKFPCLFFKDGKVYKAGTPVEVESPERFFGMGAVLIAPSPEEGEQTAKPKRAPRKKREA
jgi:hypothetical protein